MNSVFEKMKEKLEEKCFSAELYNNDFNGQTVENLICLGDAVKIIDQVAEECEKDVCEWSPDASAFMGVFKTSCGNSFAYHPRYKHCPLCGKRIKVVK